MQTLDAPVFEVNQDSEWYKNKKQQKEDTKNFFKIIKEKYGLSDGFAFYHSDYFGIYGGTKDYETYKNELVKTPTEKDDFYPFKKRSKYYKEIKELIQQITEIYSFKSHDVFGLNNVSASQWVGDRWFFGVNNEEYIKEHKEIVPIDYKEYLKIVMETLD